MKRHALPPPPALDFDITLDFDDEQPPTPTAPPHSTQLFGSIDSALAAIAPQGSTLTVIGYADTERFARRGYRLVDRDADITAVRGGVEDCERARRITRGKLVVQPTEDFVGAVLPSYLARDGAFFTVKHGVRPHAAVFDENDPPECLAAAFGEIATLELRAFDHSFGQMLRGNRVPREMISVAAKIVSDATAALKNREKDARHAAHAIADGARRVAETMRAYPELRFSSGATQIATALRMLCTAESRNTCRRGEAEMLLSRYVTELYMKNICGAPSLFPPDYNRHTECVCKYFGGDPARSCIYAARVLSPEELRLREYRCREFRDEYIRDLAALRERLNAAFAVFKRLYRDDGFGLSKLLDSVDVGICTAVAPDVFPADTALTHFKHTGLLEKYLI